MTYGHDWSPQGLIQRNYAERRWAELNALFNARIDSEVEAQMADDGWPGIDFSVFLKPVQTHDHAACERVLVRSRAITLIGEYTRDTAELLTGFDAGALRDMEVSDENDLLIASLLGQVRIGYTAVYATTDGSPGEDNVRRAEAEGIETALSMGTQPIAP